MMFPEMHLIVEGRKISDSWFFYTTNVLNLGTITHEQFCKEFPETSKILEKLTRRMKKLEQMTE